MVFEDAKTIELGSDDIALVVHYGSIAQHVGFAVLAPKQARKFLHLAFHKVVKFEEFPPVDRCAIAAKLPFSKLSLMSLKSALRIIGSRCQHIPYGVNIDKAKGSFDKNGKYSVPAGSDGLTCSTFVSEICRGVGLEILNEHDWPVRDEDRDWIEKICALLASVEAEQSHIDRVRAGFNGIRIRPEEVASVANLWKGKALDFKPAEIEGLAIIEKLGEVCTPPLSKAESTLTAGASGAALKPSVPNLEVQTPPKAAQN